MRRHSGRGGHTWLTSLALLLALPRSVSALGATPETQPYRYLAVIAGECERLVLIGDDATSGCADRLVNIDFGNGQVAFVFTSPSGADGAVVTTFLGRSSVQKNLGAYRLEVDQVSTTTGTDAAPANVVEKATGHCVMTGDPTRERARFECTAERPAGRTTATFVSAGVPTVYAGDRGEGDEAATVAAAR